MAASPKVVPSTALCPELSPTDFNKNVNCSLKLPYSPEKKDEAREICRLPCMSWYPTFDGEYSNIHQRRRRCKSEGVDLECSPIQFKTIKNDSKKRLKIVGERHWKSYGNSAEELRGFHDNSKFFEFKKVNEESICGKNWSKDKVNLPLTLKSRPTAGLYSNQNLSNQREKYLQSWNQDLTRGLFCRNSNHRSQIKNHMNAALLFNSSQSSESSSKDIKVEERYRREMEVLRCKLYELHGGDSKQLRQLSDSDICGNSYTTSSATNALSETKRPRDCSPVCYRFRNEGVTILVCPSFDVRNKFRVVVTIESTSFELEAVLPPYPSDEHRPNCSLGEENRRRPRDEETCATASMMICFDNEDVRPLPSDRLPVPNVICTLNDVKNGGYQNAVVDNFVNCSKKPKSDFSEMQSRAVQAERQCKSTKFEDFSSPSPDSEYLNSPCDEEEMKNISALVKINSQLQKNDKDTIDISDSLCSTETFSTNVPNSLCSISTLSEIETKSDEPLSELHPALRLSLFTNVPPYVHFSSHDIKGPALPPNIQKSLKWKLSSITPVVVRYTILNSGFKLVRKSNEWTGTWGKHMKSVCFKTLKDYQKINHFPGSFQIGRKDRLWKNLSRLMNKFGKKEFGFSPKTYVLPQDTKLLRCAWEKNCGKEKWIIKPPASARGTGIKVISKWGHIPRKVPLVVQKYIDHPYLINSTKFDLRLYVLVTSMNPLKIYMYDNGLVRFASVKYSSDPSMLNERYMHLTNYSINKESSQYTQNQNADACEGHKWTLKTLWSYLEREHKVDVNALWESLVDVVIKTLICGESSIYQLTQANLPSRYCAYELFGIDILFDQLLKPWLLEVNISPSLHSSSPLDLAVKGPLVRDLMNIVGFQIPPKLSGSSLTEAKKTLGVKSNLCFDKRMFTALISSVEREKQMAFTQMESRDDYLNSILEDLTPDDVRHLVIYEDELTQLGSFQKVFPTVKTHAYHNFFEAPRYYNRLFDAWEVRYHKNRSKGIALLESKCKLKVHLDVSQINFNTTKASCTQNSSQQDPPKTNQAKDETPSEAIILDKNVTVNCKNSSNITW